MQLKSFFQSKGGKRVHKRQFYNTVMEVWGGGGLYKMEKMEKILNNEGEDIIP